MGRFRETERQGARWKKVESLRRDVEEGKGKKRERGGELRRLGRRLGLVPRPPTV
jgi:hypothetical protein